MKINKIILFIIILYIICSFANKYRRFFHKMYRNIKINEESIRSSNIHNIFEPKNISTNVTQLSMTNEKSEPVEIINDKSIQTENVQTQDKLIQTEENN